VIPESPLAKKMKIRPGRRVAVVNASAGHLEQLGPLPSGVEIKEALQGTFDWAQVFAQNRKELETVLPRAVRALKPEGLLWLSFPKGTSNIQTDLTWDKGWDSLRNHDLKWANLISVDATWSAFALRPYWLGESRQPSWV